MPTPLPPLSDFLSERAEGLAEPTHPTAKAAMADLLTQIRASQADGDLDAAEQCCAQAIEQDPHPDLLTQHATLARARGDLATAIHRWEILRKAAPDRQDGYVEAAKCLRDLGDFATATQLLETAMAQLPHAEAPLIEHAWLAQIAKDWPAALDRWQSVRSRLPQHHVGFTAGAIALREAGRTLEAETLLDEALTRFPDQADVLSERAVLAQARRAWPEAAERWHALRRIAPDRLEAYTAGAHSLREAGRPSEAGALLAEAATRFPQDPGLAVAQAQGHERTGDWTSATAAWAAIRTSFPHLLEAWLGGARALRATGQPDAADTLLRAAATHFPNSEAPVFEYAWRAHHSRDWPEALGRWAVICTHFPDNPAGYIGRAVSLRELRRDAEADRLLESALARFPTHAACAIEYAWLRHARRDWQGALPRWIAVCTRFPDQPDPWLRRAIAEIELWQYEAAEATLREAMHRFPDHQPLAAEYAAIAVRQTRWEEALDRYADLRSRFPHDVTGLLGAVGVLRSQFRLAEAEAMLQTAMQEFPQDPRPHLQHALLPVVPLFRKDRRYDTALRRLAELRRRFPTFLEGFVTSTAMLRELNQLNAAERVAASWTGEADVTLAIERARIAEATGDQDAALTRFTELRDRFPEIPAGYIGLSGALSRGGRHEEADHVIADAIARFPGDAGIAAEHGQVAARRHDWQTALSRWTEAQQRFPDDQQFVQRIYEAQTRLSEIEPDPDAAPPVIDRAGPFKAEIDLSLSADLRQQMRDLAMQFESLGGRDIGCEFGMVQRACGAEPLGLLRWADMTPEALTTALENRFAGVGEPEYTELFLDGLNRPEYCTRDRRGMMYSRAFIYEDEIPFDKMYTQSCRRLKFLARKLIDDLEQGSKIFVYRFSRRDLTEAELSRLHTAMQSFGRNTLLYVRYADETHPPGTVELSAPGLMIGYMEKFKVSRSGQLDAVPPTDAWMTVCRGAYALWSQAQ